MSTRSAIERKEVPMRTQTISSVSVLLMLSGCASAYGDAGDAPGGGDPAARTNQELASQDFGLFRDQLLSALQKPLFGFVSTVPNSTASVDAATANADPTSLINVAKGLKVHVVSAAANLGPSTDMIALWPDDLNPTHLIVINEQGPTAVGVQRIQLSDGLVETILTGTQSGDPVQRTPWGTILVGEEVGGTGQVIEIINPLETTGVSFDRTTGVASGGVGAENVVARRALGRLAFEGLAILANGVVYYGDELAPSNGNPGGAYFKFVPSTPHTAEGPIASLSESPLANGQVYGLKLTTGTNNGQGNNTGLGSWVAVPNSNNANLRTATVGLGLAGFYRPEDAHLDGAVLATGNVRVCGNNTGNEGARNFGETVCINDGAVADSTTNATRPELQLFVIGNPDFAMPDNIAYNPRTNIWAILEDGAGPDVGLNNDIWACLQDGADADLLSDGCVRFASLNDLNAESTGGVFDGSGRNFYVSIQHNVTGHGVVLRISGF
jgi:Alkaline phosphatase PhoX